MGVGLALSEGTMLDDQGRQRNPHLLDYKLVTCSDAPEIEVEWIEYDSVRARAARRASASRPRCRPPARSRTRSRRCSGAHVRQLPMTPERVWAAARETRR